MAEERFHFMELAAERCSVRRFAAREVERETIEQILRAGNLAPTACNIQPQRILVLQSAQARERLKKCTRYHFDAPAALLVCADTAACWVRACDGKSSADVDASIVTTHLMLEAWALGVGTTWVMSFDPAAMRREFALPPALEPVALLVLGYPHEDAQPHPRHAQRKPLEETVVWEQF